MLSTAHWNIFRYETFGSEGKLSASFPVLLCTVCVALWSLPTEARAQTAFLRLSTHTVDFVLCSDTII